MDKIKYNQVEIPKTLDEIIDQHVEKAVQQKSQNRKKLYYKTLSSAVASIAILFMIGFMNPVLATQLPIVGSVFKFFDEHINELPNTYSDYGNDVSQSVTSNGVTMTLSEAFSDGESVYVSYMIKNENEEPLFDYEEKEGTGVDKDLILYGNLLETSIDSKRQLGDSGGMFINDFTYVGMLRYSIDWWTEEIAGVGQTPNEIIVKPRFTQLSYSVRCEGEDSQSYDIEGEWAFEIPVTVNQNLKRTFVFDGIEHDVIEENKIKLNNLAITPFNLTVEFNNFDYLAYDVKAYDEQGVELQLRGYAENSESDFSRYTYEAPSLEMDEIRIVVVKFSDEKDDTSKPIDKNGKPILDEARIPFNQVIPLK